MDVSQDLIDALARHLVEASAPSEAPLFAEIVREAKSAPSRGASNPLGSGVGESWALAQFVTPIAMAVATWAAKDVLGKAVADAAVAKLKPLVERLFSKVLRIASPGSTPAAGAAAAVSDEDLQTLQAAIEHVARKQGASPERVQQLSEGVQRLMREA